MSMQQQCLVTRSRGHFAQADRGMFQQEGYCTATDLGISTHHANPA